MYKQALQIGCESDNEEQCAIFEKYKGRTILRATLGTGDFETKHFGLRDDATWLCLVFEECNLYIFDGEQDCCEIRHMDTEDDLNYFAGSTLLDMSIVSKQSEYLEDWGDRHDTQFVVIHTSKGAFTVQTHNIHNGYYGGFRVMLQEGVPT